MAAPRFESQVALECSCLRCAGGARQRGRARRPQTRLGQCGAARGTRLTDADLAGRSPAKPGPGWTSALSLLKTVVRPGLKIPGREWVRSRVRPPHFEFSNAQSSRESILLLQG